MTHGEWKEVERSEPNEYGDQPFEIVYSMDSGSLTADVRRDGCVHVRKFWNGATPESDPNEDNTDYLHVCDLDRFISQLQALRERIRKDYAEGWPET